MHPLLVLRLRGTQQDMGAQHGALLRQVGGWEAVQAYYPEMPLQMLLAAGRRGKSERVLAAVLRPVLERGLDALDRNRIPDLRARSRAFVEALGMPVHTARYLGVMDAFQNVVGLLARYKLVPVAQRAQVVMPPACSTIMLWGARTEDGRLLHARNFDFPGTGVWEKQPAVVFCTPDEGLRYGFTTTRGSDVPATAFNEAGLTLTAHTRFHQDVTFQGLAITDLCHDIIRRAATLDEAVKVAREHRSASSWGVCVSSARERSAVVLEFTAAGVEVTRPEPGSDFLASTNRYHHPALRVREVAPSAAWASNCDGRLQALLGQGRGASGWGPEDCMRALGDRRDPETGVIRSAGNTLAQPSAVHSLVTDYDRGVIHVSVGDVPTGAGPFAEVPLDWDGPEVAWITEARTPEHPELPADFVEAATHYLDACRLEQQAGRPEAIEAAIGAALQLQPQDPDYRFLAGAWAARGGRYQEALTHFAVGLDHERSAFPRGQLLLWASRVADQLGDKRAESWRRELLSLRHPLLADHQEAAHREQRRPYPRRAVRGMPVHVQLVDAG